MEHTQGGDDIRRLAPMPWPNTSGAYLWANRNKRSVALDLHLRDAQQVAQELARQADVVVENFLPGAMARYGLSHEDLTADNPDLVYCSVTAFGTEGELARRPGYDQIAQAKSGFFSLNGDPDRPPYKAGAPVMDVSSALMTCNAILGALMARERGHGGQRLEVCLYDTAIFMTGHFAMNHLVTGQEQHRYGNGSQFTQPTGLFKASDGEFFLSCATQRNFERLARDVVEMPALVDDPRYSTDVDRNRHRDSLHAVLSTEFARRGREEWLKRALAAGVPMGLVRSISEALNSPEIKARGLVTQCPAADGGTVPNIAPPFRFDRTPVRQPTGAPLLGQHTTEVLKHVLGYSDERIASLELGLSREPRT